MTYITFYTTRKYSKQLEAGRHMIAFLIRNKLALLGTNQKYMSYFDSYGCPSAETVGRRSDSLNEIALAL